MLCSAPVCSSLCSDELRSTGVLRLSSLHCPADDEGAVAGLQADGYLVAHVLSQDVVLLDARRGLPGHDVARELHAKQRDAAALAFDIICANR